MPAFREFSTLYYRQRRQEGGFETICETLRQWPDLEAQDARGSTLYHLAAQERDVELAQFLADEGCKCRPDAFGCSPLNRLSDISTFEIDRLPERGTALRQLSGIFIAAGANLRRKDEAGKTPAFHAVNAANWVMVSSLIEHGANFDDSIDEGKTLLHVLAVRMGQQKHHAGFIAAGKKTLSLILEHQLIDPEAKDIFGTSAQTYLQRANLLEAAALFSDDPQEAAGGMRLDQAVVLRNLDAVNTLLGNGADANLVSDEYPGRTALMLACEYPDSEIVAALLAAGADANFHSGEHGRSCVYYLLAHGFGHLGSMRPNQIPPAIRQSLRLLEKHGLKASDRVDDRGNTALHLIVARRKLGQMHMMNNAEQDLLDSFLDMGASPDALNLDGLSALMLHAEEGDESKQDIAQTLLDAGAQVQLKDNAGRTALHYAAMNDRPMSGHKIARFLLEKDSALAAVTDNDGKTALDYAVEKNQEILIKLLLEYI